MDERTANQLAAILGGEAWQNVGQWQVTVNRADGAVVLVSGDGVSEYATEADFDGGRASQTIPLEIPDAEDLYVLVDTAGSVYYLDSATQRGWLHEGDAEHEAKALCSRGEGRFTVVRQGELP